MKLNAMSRMSNIESQIRDQIKLETAPAMDELTEFVIDHYTIDQCGQIDEVFRYDVWEGFEPSPEDYEVAASIWNILPDHIRIRLLDLETSLKSFSEENLLERLGAYKRVEAAGQSAPPS
jgi:hypothetical protein